MISKQIEALLESVDWQPVDPPDDVSDGIPYTTMKGVLQIEVPRRKGTFDLRCYILSDGRRIIDAEGMAAFLDSGVARREVSA